MRRRRAEKVKKVRQRKEKRIRDEEVGKRKKMLE